MSANDYKSEWVVDRKIYEGVLYRLQYTACGKPKCRAGCPRPSHGPYWFKLDRPEDGRDFVRYVGKKPPWPVENPPPSLAPAEEDPTSRSRTRRAKREATLARRAAARAKT